jgi:tetratricopeptide (TPR) repeat protein
VLKTRTLPGILAFTLFLAFAFFTDKSDAVAQSTSTSVARERGLNLYREGRNDEAIRALKTAVKEDKTDHQAWYFLGLAQIASDSFKDAAKSLQNVIKLQPAFAPGHNALAFTSLRRNRLTDAMREAETAVRLDSTLKEAYYVIGVVNLRLGNSELALKAAEGALKLDSRFAAALLLKSQSLVAFLGTVPTTLAEEPSESRQIRYRQAATALEKYLELVPNADDKQTWLDQLESLRFYATSHAERSDSDRVYRGNEVKTKAVVLAKPLPEYTQAARDHGVAGTVVLRAVFAADGRVKYLLLLVGLPYGLSERAIAAARKIKFTPATLDGKPVPTYIQLEYNFHLF